MKTVSFIATLVLGVLLINVLWFISANYEAIGTQAGNPNAILESQASAIIVLVAYLIGLVFSVLLHLRERYSLNAIFSFFLIVGYVAAAFVFHVV